MIFYYDLLLTYIKSHCRAVNTAN